MDTARCTLDNVSYHAHQFALLPLAELEKKRRGLVCDECGNEAYFRKASTRGQDACFGARPHAPGCGAAAAEGVRTQPGGEEQDILNNPGEIITLDLNFGAAPQTNPFTDMGGGQTGRGGQYTGHAMRPNARSRRRLRPILRNLIYSDQFRLSRQTLELPDRPAQLICNFFVHFGEIEQKHVDHFHGFWGMAVDVGQADDEGGIWLNSGSYRSFSILVPGNVKQELLNRTGKQNAEQLAGCHVLVLGKLSKSTSSGKLWVKLDEIGFCAVYED